MMRSKYLLLAFMFFSGSSLAAAISPSDLAKAAMERTEFQVRYDGSYIALKYPGGDVPPGIGVCTDVVIRSYRALGIDLQVRVHEDMKSNFHLYPSKHIWGLTRTDTNIDHRRVPNLQKFFARHGETLATDKIASLYQPGDIVTWMLPGNLPHIGIVSDRTHWLSDMPMIIHNIGAGPKLDNMLFDYPITGHYRYFPEP